MKFSGDKKKAILFYLLEKIDQGDSGISKMVAENFRINQNTVHNYINELADQQIIRRVKRDQYELVNETYEYHLQRSKGELDTDTYAFGKCLREHIERFSPNVQEIWSYAFCEMMNNVADHSDAENVHICIVQNYLNTKVLIIDDGVGIFRKIREYFSFDSLDDAVCELFKGKLTTDKENHSGEGIFFSSRLMDDFLILSDEKIFTVNKYEDSILDDIGMEASTGTAVLMELSNFTHKESKEVFDLYANIEGGFVKTKIPLKNMFDASPVSRSQARLVCNRLEQFQEVIIDFEGIKWMGQGFAHQIFVVFAKAHPQIHLLPVHMNEDVTKMYVHVTDSSN